MVCYNTVYLLGVYVVRLSFCCVCGTNKDLEHHHFIPRVEGGSDDDDNIITFCATHHDFVHGWRRVHRTRLHRIAMDKAKAEGKFKGRVPTARAKAGKVRELAAAGMTKAAIAAELGISLRSVFRCLDALKTDDKKVNGSSSAVPVKSEEIVSPPKINATTDFLREIYGRAG
jgi:hypothetical protein